MAAPNVRRLNMHRKRTFVLTRKSTLSALTHDTTTNNTGGLVAFTPVSNIPEFSGYATLFQQFRVIRCIFTYNYTTLEGTDDASVPRIIAGPVVNTPTTPTLATIADDQNQYDMMFTATNRRATIVTIPYHLIPLYSGVVTSQYKREYRKWLDIDSSANDTVFYALQWYQTATFATNQQVLVDIEYHIQYRGDL